MNIPEELKYTKSHEWIRMEDGTAEIGITDFAQDALGDIVFINLPQAGDSVSVGEAFCDVESVKAVSDVLSPVSGVISEVNEELGDAPEKLNSDPYGSWIVKVKDISGEEEMLAAADYAAVCRKEE